MHLHSEASSPGLRGNGGAAAGEASGAEALLALLERGNHSGHPGHLLARDRADLIRRAHHTQQFTRRCLDEPQLSASASRCNRASLTAGLRTDWAVFDSQFAHREMLRIAGRQRHPDRDGHGRDHAVRLRQRDTVRCVITAPVAGLDALKPIDGRDTQAVDEVDRRGALAFAQAAMNLLDIDRRRKRYLAVLPKRSEALHGPRPPLSTSMSTVVSSRRSQLANSAEIS